MITLFLKRTMSGIGVKRKYHEMMIKLSEVW